MPIIVEEEESENEQQPIVSTITEENIYASSSDEIISKDVVVDLFPLYSPKAHNDDDFRCDKKLIKLNSSDVIRLLNLFEPTYENFENYLYPIFHSPFKGESILEIVLGWYSNGTEHENDKIIQYYNESFNIVKTNEWLFRIINVLNEKQKRIILEKYLCNTIDESQRFDTTSQIFFTSLASERNYKKESGYGIRVGEFLTDLKQVVARINTVPPVFVVKERSIEYHRAQIKILNEKEFYSQLKSIKLGVYKEGKKTKEINALDVYSAGINSDFLTYSKLAFYSSEPGVFNIFQGYEFKPMPKSKFSEEPIIAYEKHIFDIICNGNIDVYNYVMK